MFNNKEYLYYNLVNGSTPAITVFTGRGTLHSVIVNSPSPSTITVSDGSTNIANIVSAPVGDIQFDVVIANSLKVLCADASPKILITYTKG